MTRAKASGDSPEAGTPKRTLLDLGQRLGEPDAGGSLEGAPASADADTSRSSEPPEPSTSPSSAPPSDAAAPTSSEAPPNEPNSRAPAVIESSSERSSDCAANGETANGETANGETANGETANGETANGETQMRCPRCGQHFPREARFCPFDREALVDASQWDPTGDPLLGQVIDQRYCVEAVIGEGGMGRVYRVRHVSLGKRFALKALRKDLASDEEIATRFIHEARTAASVTHPGLVQISDFGHLPSGQAYFVMELLDGVPLSALLRRYGALPPERAVQLALKIAEALAVAHEAGVVHRDLKPDNIHVRLLEEHDEIKIVDFGLAKVVGASRLTRDGVVFGTPYYMSPEQASGDATDHRADIYALGILLYEMVTGRVPFEADTYMGVLTKHIYMKPVPPSEVLGLKGSLGALDDVVLRCLEKKPEKRFAKLAELHAALMEVPKEPLRKLAGLPPRPSEPPREELDTAALQTLNRRQIPGWVLGVGLLVVSAALGALVVGALVGRSETTSNTRPPSLALDAPTTELAPAASPVPTAAELAPVATAVPTALPPAAPTAPAAALSAAPAPLTTSSAGVRSTRPTSPARRVPAGKPKKVLSPSNDIVDPWAK